MSQYQQKEVVLGFLENPKNQLVLSPEFTPSKFGGDPANISASEQIGNQTCGKCGHKLTFLMQLYANIEHEAMDDYHRMLYVFACLGETCIDSDSSVKCLSCVVPNDSKHIKFAADTEFDEIVGKTNNQLISLGYKVKSEREQEFEKAVEEEKEQASLADAEEEESKTEEVNLKAINIRLKEFLIDSDVEPNYISKVYFKQVKKFEMGVEGGLNREYHFYRKKKIIERQMAEASESSDNDEDGELVDNLYSATNFGTTQEDERRAKDMLKRYEQAEEELEKMEQGLPESERMLQKEKEGQMEDMNKEANDKNDVSTTYKLYNYVLMQNKDQVIRYLPPMIFRDYAFVEPLWASQKKRLDMKRVPKCPRCNQDRQFELQIMPTLFNQIEELMMVDWDTIAIFTCVNPDCLSDLKGKTELVSEEFAFIQISEDFNKVQYGNEEQIAQEKKMREQQAKTLLLAPASEQIPEQDKEMEEIQKEAEQQATQEAAAAEKKKKKKAKKKKEKEDSEQIQSQVQEELGELISGMNLGGDQK